MGKINSLIYFHLVILLFCLTILVCKSEGNEASTMTIQNAIETANKEAIRLGFSLQKMTIDADEKNTSWLENIERMKSYWKSKGILNKLENKKFWAIHYVPKHLEDDLQLSGDLWVFVDKTNGEILAIKASQ